MMLNRHLDRSPMDAITCEGLGRVYTSRSLAGPVALHRRP